MASEYQAKASKRELMKRPRFRRMGAHMDEIRSRSGSPRSTRPSSPQPTRLLPADAAPSPRDATRVLNVLVPPSEDSVLEPLAQEALCSSTSQTLESVSSVPIEHSNQDQHAPPLPELRPDQPRDGLEESAQLDALPRVQNRKVFCFPPDAAETDNWR
ncbi:hypothetical protein BKA70DRAFT_1407439 [Coprinopsis sp. MPI-PUGE-AT-0042]|nr:hypothetical protein BKA70DRAFT_1407439 [Coprinopsis sp. MPI-PUGE-AT-0042]